MTEWKCESCKYYDLNQNTTFPKCPNPKEYNRTFVNMFQHGFTNTICDKYIKNEKRCENER